MYEVQLETIMLIPMYLIVFFTIMSLLTMVIVRSKAVLAKEIPISFFEAKQKDTNITIPKKIIILDNHFKNLLELPVLFYVACVVTVLQGDINEVLVILAWLFLLFRLGHSVIHLTYNNVTHRLIVFLLSVFTVAGMWGVLFYNFLF